MRTGWRAAAAALAATAVVGCGNAGNFLNNAGGADTGFYATNEAGFMTADARQRFVLNMRRDGTNGEDSFIVTCAEPSPDVAQQATQGMSGSFSMAGRTAAGPSGEGGGSIDSSIATSLIELGRRQTTVQLLRDSLYRACEAYANGAIDPSMYAVILSRLDDVMVTLMSTESMSSAKLKNGADPAGAGDKAAPEAESFVQILQTYLDDDRSTPTSLAVACIAELNRTDAQGGKRTLLTNQCEKYFDMVVPAVIQRIDAVTKKDMAEAEAKRRALQ